MSELDTLAGITYIDPTAPTVVALPAEPRRRGLLIAAIAFACAIAASVALARTSPERGLVDAVSKLLAAAGAAWLFQSLESRLYRRLRRHGRARRFVTTLAAVVLADALVVAGVLIASRLSPLLGDRATLALALAIGGVWFTSASFGSLVLIAFDSPRRSLGVRIVVVTTATLVLVGLAAVAIARFSPRALGFLIEQAPLAVEAVKRLAPLAKTIGPSAAWVVVALGLLALPALSSACVKVANLAVEQLSSLRAAADAVSEGRLGLRVEEAGGPELTKLSRSYNEMIGSLEQKHALERIFGPRSPELLGRLRMRFPDPTIPVAGRTATVVVGDVREFEQVLESTSPENLLVLLGRFYERALAAVEKHDGYLVSVDSASLVAVFNLPIDQADHMLRGTRCAIELQTEVASMNRGGETNGIGKLSLAVGVATGPVAAGTIEGGNGRYLIAGETVDLATRLAALTPSDQVWVNQTNAETLPLYIPSLMLAAVSMRGSKRPVAPYRVWPPP